MITKWRVGGLANVWAQLDKERAIEWWGEVNGRTNVNVEEYLLKGKTIKVCTLEQRV